MANPERSSRIVSAFGGPLYESGDNLTAHQLTSEQQYRLRYLRRHNRYLHGWGILCGLWVVPASERQKPWEVQVCPGYAIGPCGEEIEVRVPMIVSVHDHAWRKPQTPTGATSVAIIGIRYRDTYMRPVPAQAEGCGCLETTYQDSRIRDDCEIVVLWSMPNIQDAQRFDLCAGTSNPCHGTSGNSCIPLACISLPPSERQPIRVEHIDNRVCRA